MNKILLIIRREYITRVRRRVFLITTLLAPLIIASFTVVPIYLANVSTEDQHIAVLDQSNLFKDKLENKGHINFTYVNESFDSLQKNYDQQGYTGVLYIPSDFTLDKPANISYYSKDQLGLISQGSMQDRMNDVIRKLQFERANISTDVMNNINNSSVNVVQVNKEHSSAGVATALGYIMGFMIYIALLLYGTQVMRGVMEEKSNRIAEVVISSVKPFQLMMGKIIGIGLVGLTQFVIWIVLVAITQSILGGMYGDQMAQAQQMQAMGGGMGQTSAMQQISGVIADMNQLPLTLIVAGFLFFFIGGYMLYASMFAAIGAAAGDESDQSLTFVATFPIIISIIILMSVLNEPNGKLAVICSFIPFTAPVVMCGRLPFVPPTWQILLAMVLLIAGFLFMVWLAAKIYRTGILMYGKKTSLREMIKWVRY